MKKDFKTSFLILIGAAAAIRLLTAFFNYGFLALDDYYILSTIIPSQLAPGFACQVELADIRSPLPYLFVYGMSRLALLLGLEDPLSQIRFLYGVLGLISLGTVYYGAKTLEFRENKRWVLFGAFILSFHFLMPYLSTRSLLENMSAPFLMSSLYFLVRYHSKGRTGDIALATALLAISSMFRFQNGMVLPVYLYIIALRHSVKDLVWTGVTGLGMLIATGLPDLFLRGYWHESLISYIDYNIHHSSEYGVEPFWAYIPTILAMSLSPFFISKYKGFSFRENYRELLPVTLTVMVFVVGHSFIPHKEERFLIPVLPAVLILLVPAIDWFYEKGFRKRLMGLAITNAILLFVASFQISQYNSIGLVRFIHSHHNIKKLFVFSGSLHHFPISYGHRPEVKIAVAGPGFSASKEVPEDCPFTLAIRDDLIPANRAVLKDLEKIQEFQPEFAEKILIYLNPSSNGRRRAIHLYAPKDLESRTGNCRVNKETPEPTGASDKAVKKGTNFKKQNLPRKIQGSDCGLEFFGIPK